LRITRGSAGADYDEQSGQVSVYGEIDMTAELTEPGRREILYGLTGKHLAAYDAIVRPDSVVAIRIYTLRRWAPILGASGCWLLVALQQLCYRNPKGRSWCTVNREKLAQEANLSEATVHRYLHGEEYVSSGLCHWVQSHPRRRWSQRAGRAVQADSRYTVVMDAPLAPVDQRGLVQFLMEQGVQSGIAASRLEGILGRLVDLKLADLLDLCAEHASRFQPPPGWTESTFLPTVADVVRFLGVVLPTSRDERLEFLALCDRVQQAFVNQKYLGTQYFRQKWLPLLGPKLALVVVQLRSRCFWNEKERRDEISLHFTDLARESDCSARWLRDINETQPLSREFFAVEPPGRGKLPTFRVMLLEPIAAQDQAQYKALLEAGSIGSETGQLELPEVELRTELADLSEAENGTGERLGMARTEPVNSPEIENGTGEQLGALRTEPVNSSEAVRTNPVNGSEVENGTGERLSAYSTLVSISTLKRKALKQQKHPGSPAAATALLLEDFGIGAPSSSQIIALNPDPTDVLAWMLYTLTQPGLRKPADARGFVVNRLKSRESPPTQFRLWANLSPKDWQALWRAHHYSGPYLTALPPPLAQEFELWERDFGGIFPEGPFGEGVFDAAILRECLEKRLGAPPGQYEISVEPDCCVVLTPLDAEVVTWLEVHAEEIVQTLAEFGVLHRVTIGGLEEEGQARNTIANEPFGEVWQVALRELQLQMTRATFDTHLRNTHLIHLEDGVTTITVGSEYARDWLENRLKPLVARTLAGVLGHEVEVQFVVTGEGETV
jgi:hypothetical protein